MRAVPKAYPAMPKVHVADALQDPPRERARAQRGRRPTHAALPGSWRGVGGATHDRRPDNERAMLAPDVSGCVISRRSPSSTRRSTRAIALERVAVADVLEGLEDFERAGPSSSRRRALSSRLKQADLALFGEQPRAFGLVWIAHVGVSFPLLPVCGGGWLVRYAPS